MKAIERLLTRAMKLPEPYRTRACLNIGDAERDLIHWFSYAPQIIRDCEQAVTFHELDAKEEAP